MLLLTFLKDQCAVRGNFILRSPLNKIQLLRASLYFVRSIVKESQRCTACGTCPTNMVIVNIAATDNGRHLFRSLIAESTEFIGRNKFAICLTYHCIEPGWDSPLLGASHTTLIGLYSVFFFPTVSISNGEIHSCIS